MCHKDSPYIDMQIGQMLTLRMLRLSMVHLQLKDLLELFVKRREFLPGSKFSISSSNDGWMQH